MNLSTSHIASANDSVNFIGCNHFPILGWHFGGPVRNMKISKDQHQHSHLLFVSHEFLLIIDLISKLLFTLIFAAKVMVWIVKWANSWKFMNFTHFCRFKSILGTKNIRLLRAFWQISYFLFATINSSSIFSKVLIDSNLYERLYIVKIREG